MGLFGKKKKPASTNKHYYVIDGTQLAKSISKEEIDIPFSMDEATYLVNILNTIKNQGKCSFKLDSPQMYIEIIIDMYLQDLAIGMDNSINNKEGKVVFSQSYEELFNLYVNFKDIFENNQSINSSPTAKRILEQLGRALAFFIQRIRMA